MDKAKPKLKDRLIALAKKTSQIYVAMKSPRTPWYAKILGFFIIGYALSPIDIIPDFIPVLGYLDDLIILPILIWLCIKMIPIDVWEESESKAMEIWQNGKPTKWYLAIPILLLWGIIIYFIIRAFI